MAVDVNGDGKTQTSLTGFDDWANLDLRFQCSDEYFADGAPHTSEYPEELSLEEAKALGVLYPELHPDLDLSPLCTADEVATDGTGQIQVAVLGTETFDVTTIDLATLSLAGQPLFAHAVRDVTADGFDDLVAEFENNVVTASPPDALVLSARRYDSQVVTNFVFPVWVSTSSDQDGDGVEDVCDGCPNTYSGPADPDGCP